MTLPDEVGKEHTTIFKISLLQNYKYWSTTYFTPTNSGTSLPVYAVKDNAQV